jgi:Glutaredoxin-related protein
MSLIVYGADICSDCREAKVKLNAAGIPFEYRDITASTKTLKEFLRLRDSEKIFEPVKKAGGIGIPLFILEDGTKTLDPDFIDAGKSCSLSDKECRN